MILQLLKQLPVALSRYLAFRVNRLVGRPRMQPGTPAAGIATARASGTKTMAVPPPTSVAKPAGYSVGLAPALGADVSWPTYSTVNEADELKDNALFNIWLGIPGGHKWTHYFSAYQRVFGSVRHASLRVLEIGVFRGNSIKMWRSYFDHPETVITAIDIDPSCARFDDPANAMHVMIGDQSDEAFLSRVVQQHGPFDIIIDDGSHQSSHIIASFNFLFLNGLKATGTYVAEDLHASYWIQYRDSELSFIDVAKQMVELMHSHYARVSSIGAYTALFKKPGDSMQVPHLTTIVDEIRFFDSMVVISKTLRPFASGSLLNGS